MTMVTRKTAAGKAKGKKLKLKRETIKDLGSKKSGAVKGGGIKDNPTYVLSCACVSRLFVCK